MVTLKEGLRCVESYMPESEQRFFVVNGAVYSPNETIPSIVQIVAESTLLRRLKISQHVVNRVVGRSVGRGGF